MVCKTFKKYRGVFFNNYGDNLNKEYAVSDLYKWFKENQSYFYSKEAEIEFKDSGRNSAFVRIETKAYLAELSAWDHASCLDIQIIEIDSDKTTFPHTGVCESKTVFQSHLHNFLLWFESVV